MNGGAGTDMASYETALAGVRADMLFAGVNTGEVEIIGDDIAGIAVHIGARIGALASGGECTGFCGTPNQSGGGGCGCGGRRAGAHVDG